MAKDAPSLNRRTTSRPTRRWLRIFLCIAAGIVVLIGGAQVALQVAIARGALTTRVDAALERAIGRGVTHGAGSLRPGLWPRIGLVDASIANIEGGSAPDFARIGRLEVTLALLPLLTGRVQVDSLLLADAEILLERDAAGQANWIFQDRASPSGGSGISIAALDIESSRVLIPGSPIDRVDVVTLTITRREPRDPIALAGNVRLNGEAFSIAASIGLEADGALPLTAKIAGAGLRLSIEGAMPRSMASPGWSLAVDAQAEQGTLPRLAAAFGQAELPFAPGPIALAARLGPGSPHPAVSDLTIRLGATDLDGLLPGLRVSQAEALAPTFDEPVRLSGQGRHGDAAFGLAATLPSLRVMLEAPASEPWPVEADLTSGATVLTLAGSVRRDQGLDAATFDAHVTSPDLSQLGPLVGAALPRLTGLTARAQVSHLSAAGLRITALAATADALEAQGDLEIAFEPRTALRGRVAIRRLDLDAIGGARTMQRAQQPPRQIRDLALPVEALGGIDVALTISATTIKANGTTWRDARVTVALENGRLLLDPLVVTSPAGVLSGSARFDAAARPPQAALRLETHGRGLDLAALRRTFGMPGALDGSAEVRLDLRGRGATLAGLAATLDGEAGIAMVGGRFTGAITLSIGRDLMRALLPRGTPSGGVGVRCLALRLSAEDGVVHSQVLLAEGDFGRVEGSIALNLSSETLAARLLPDIRLMGVTVRAPVTVGGTLTAPAVGVEPAAALARVAGDAVANRLWRSSTVEFLRGATGSTPPGGDCAQALTLARLGDPGRMPDSTPIPIPLVPREVQGMAHELVRGIGGVLGGRRP